MTGDHLTPPQADSEFARRGIPRYFGRYAIAGGVAAIVLLALFLLIGQAIPVHGALARNDVAVNAWMEAHNTEVGETIFTWVSYIGAPVLVAAVVISLIVLMRRRDWLRVWAVALVPGGGLLLSEILKLIFHRARPLTAAEFMTHPTYSFPSGHAMNSVISYGFLTLLLLDRVQQRSRRVAITLGAVVFIGAIGFSRVYLGVHYVSDVVGGWLAGVAWLIAGTGGYRFAQRHYFRREPLQ